MVFTQEGIDPMSDRPKKHDEEDKNEPDKIAQTSEDVIKLPQKRYFRQRAHSNPFSDHDLV